MAASNNAPQRAAMTPGCAMVLSRTRGAMRLLAFWWIVAVAGCVLEDEWKQYDEIHADARQKVAWAVELERHFPQTDHFITHYGWYGSDTVWKSVSFFGGRYVISGRTSISVDYRNRRFKVVGTPRFYLKEVVSVAADDSSSIGDFHEFGLREFEELVKHKWDFSVIGIQIDPTRVPGFDRYVARWRGPRRPISLISSELETKATEK